MQNFLKLSAGILMLAISFKLFTGTPLYASETAHPQAFNEAGTYHSQYVVVPNFRGTNGIYFAILYTNTKTGDSRIYYFDADARTWQEDFAQDGMRIPSAAF